MLLGTATKPNKFPDCELPNFVTGAHSGKEKGAAFRNPRYNIRISSINAGDLLPLIIRAQRTISGFEKISGKLKIDICDAAIFMACGVINLGGSTQTTTIIQFANQSSIAEYLRMPRETVRRRLTRLEEKNVISRFSSGYVVNDLDMWLRLLRAFL